MLSFSLRVIIINLARCFRFYFKTTDKCQLELLYYDPPVPNSWTYVNTMVMPFYFIEYQWFFNYQLTTLPCITPERDFTRRQTVYFADFRAETPSPRRRKTKTNIQYRVKTINYFIISLSNACELSILRKMKGLIKAFLTRFPISKQQDELSAMPYPRTSPAMLVTAAPVVRVIWFIRKDDKLQTIVLNDGKLWKKNVLRKICRWLQ